MKTRFPLIAGNWKMHKTAKETADFMVHLQALKPQAKAGIWLAVPFTSLNAAFKNVDRMPVEIGAQNMSALPSGALTGEISAAMIRETGATFVILGHSERRKIFFEDDRHINQKIKLALQSGLKVIFCIGETKEEREKGETEAVLTRQIDAGLKDIVAENASSLVIAYEPVWAIGSKNPATLEIVEEIHSLCKNHIANYWGLPLDSCKMLYGGSVNAANAKAFLELPAVDGLLIGAASLDVQSFIEIIHLAEGIQ